MPFHSDIRLDRNHVVVNEEALAHSTLVFVPIDDVLEVSRRVSGRRSGEANLNGIEVIERLAPDSCFR